MQEEKKWYAIGLNKQWGKKVKEALARKKIETYCPLNKTRKSQEDKNTSFIYRPLFDQVVFVHISEQEIPLVKQTEGVQGFLYWLGSYAIISNEDIDTIRVFLDLYTDVWFEKATVVADSNATLENTDSLSVKNCPDEKIFLPTLGYFLITQAQPEARKEILHHAI